MATLTRPNIYANVSLASGEVGYTQFAMAAGVVIAICVLIVVAALMYRSFCMESTKPAKDAVNTPDNFTELTEAEETRSVPHHEPNTWKCFFDRMLGTQRKTRSAAVHALLCMPADMRLSDSAENTELASDVHRFQRAQLRRRALDDLLNTETE